MTELGLNKARAARDVGLPESTISSYLSKTDSLPRSDIGMKIARAINVPPEWLFDDGQEWPPPSRTEAVSLEALSADELMREVCRRYRRTMIDANSVLDEAATVDWNAVARQVLETPLDAELPAAVARHLSRVESIRLMPILLDGWEASAMNGSFELPGPNPMHPVYDKERAKKRAREMWYQSTGMQLAAEANHLRSKPEQFRKSGHDPEEERQQLLAKLPPPPPPIKAPSTRRR